MQTKNQIRDFLNGNMDQRQVMQQLTAMSVDEIRCTLSNLLELCLVYYLCNVGSRPAGNNTHSGLDALISFGPNVIGLAEPLPERIDGLRELARKGSRSHESWSHVYDHVNEQTFGGIYQQLTNSHLENIRLFLPNGRIIDYGAGTGRLFRPLAQAGYRVIAVVPSTGMVAELLR